MTDNSILFKIITTKNPRMSDDEFMYEVMEKVRTRYPQVHGYQWERTGENEIHILMWGDMNNEPRVVTVEE